MELSTATRTVRGGIELIGTKVEAVVVDGASNVLGTARRPTPTAGGPDGVAAELIATLNDACTAARLEAASLQGIGVGSPGVVDGTTGSVSSARNLRWDGSFALGTTLAGELDAAVFVGNDVQVATQAEFDLGAGRLYRSLLGVF